MVVSDGGPFPSRFLTKEHGKSKSGIEKRPEGGSVVDLENFIRQNHAPTFGRVLQLYFSYTANTGRSTSLPEDTKECMTYLGKCAGVYELNLMEEEHQPAPEGGR